MKPDAIPEGRIKRGDVETGWRPDPERPLYDANGVQVGYHQVEGGRARTGADYLAAKGTLTAYHLAVADRYMETVERMGGARERSMAETRAPYAWRGHPSERQVEAAEQLRTAIEAVGKGPMGLIGAVMLDGQTLKAMAQLLGEDSKAIVGRLRAALERLGEVWGMAPVDTPGRVRAAWFDPVDISAS